MSAWIFSPDDKNFWEFMTPNFPKPMFLGQIHPGLVGTFTFCFSKKCPCSRLAQAQASFWGPGTQVGGSVRPLEAEGRLFGGVWGGGAPPLQRPGCGGAAAPPPKRDPWSYCQ